MKVKYWWRQRTTKPLKGHSKSKVLMKAKDDKTPQRSQQKTWVQDTDAKRVTKETGHHADIKAQASNHAITNIIESPKTTGSYHCFHIKIISP